MKKVARLFLVLILLLATGFVRVSAEEALPPRLQKLADEAYHYYSSRGTDNFFEAVQKVKDATEFSEYQETYYRACAYEAIYMFEYVDRQKGVALSHAIYHHAKEDKSNVGMYFATFTLGTIREQSGNYGLAEKSFLQALELKKKYLPDECRTLLSGTLRGSTPPEGLRSSEGIRPLGPRRAQSHPHESDYRMEL